VPCRHLGHVNGGAKGSQWGGVMVALTLLLLEATHRERVGPALNPLVLPAQIAANASYLMAILARGSGRTQIVFGSAPP
jgi:hypothetical protein